MTATNMPASGVDRTRTRSATDALHIRVTRGTGTGATKLAAFDAALRRAGVANYNLIRLSSVVPPAATIEIAADRAPARTGGEWGDRLYVVMAECRVDTIHEEAWAGVGWVQEPVSGKGLFVEHEGHARAQVEADIVSSLAELVVGRPGIDFGPPQMLLAGGTCAGEPLCALVVAAFESDPWRGEEVITLG